MKFVGTKKRLTTKFFFTPLLCCCFWIRDPRSGIRDPVSEIRDLRSEIRDPRSVMDKNQDLGSGIRDKHPGSATLVTGWHLCAHLAVPVIT